MTETPIAHSTYAFGDPEVLARMITEYRCGHCPGRIEQLSTNTTTGQLHATIRHSDSCPVLTGVLPQEPDLVRAAAAIPDTFRP
ncbi:hypothetical protein ACFZAM_02885 [Streptomyces sp. NPDC008079]|uniref:hypothetical protein n=1 Tax=Streptomyces sp. NPDC008079 TaxID=3364806 RepID=UPI0036E96DD9